MTFPAPRVTILEARRVRKRGDLQGEVQGLPPPTHLMTIIPVQRQGLALQLVPRALSLKAALQMGDIPYVVLELFDDGVILIADPMTGRQFKVNGNRLRPYLASKPHAPADKVNLHIHKHSRT